MTAYVGRARVHVEVIGCTDCGTVHSSGWYDAGAIEIRIDDRAPLTVGINRCQTCEEKLRKAARP